MNASFSDKDDTSFALDITTPYTIYTKKSGKNKNVSFSCLTYSINEILHNDNLVRIIVFNSIRHGAWWLVVTK